MAQDTNISKNIPTTELLVKIFSTKKIANFIKRNRAHMKMPSLAGHLTALCAEKNIKPCDAVKNADIDRIYGAEIFSGKRANPSRDYILRLSLGIGLTYKECQRLLTVAGKNELYPRIPRDAVIIKCLHEALSFHETQNMLFDMEMTLLGNENHERYTK